MIQDLKPYPAYKDSGVPWLGAVPEGWEVRKLRGLLKSVTQRNRPDLPLLSVQAFRKPLVCRGSSPLGCLTNEAGDRAIS